MKRSNPLSLKPCVSCGSLVREVSEPGEHWSFCELLGMAVAIPDPGLEERWEDAATKHFKRKTEARSTRFQNQQKREARKLTKW